MDNTNQLVPSLTAYLKQTDLFDANIWNSYSSHLLSVWKSLLNIAIDLVFIIVYSCVVMIKVFTLNVPFVMNIFDRIVVFHRTQLSPIDLALEFCLLFIFGYFAWHRKLIHSKLVKLEESLSKTNKYAAKVLPYISFFGFTALASYIGSKFLNPIVGKETMPYITLVGPAIFGIWYVSNLEPFYSIRSPDSKDIDITDHTKMAHVSKINECLTIWLIIAGYHALATFLQILPFSGTFVESIDWARRMVVIIIVWIQLSPLRANQVVVTAGPVMAELAASVPVFMSPNAHAVVAKRKRETVVEPNQGTLSASISNTASVISTPLIHVGRMSGWLTSRREELIANLAQDGLSIAVSLFCCLPLPRFIISLGILVVSFVVPLIKTAEVQMVCDAYNQGASKGVLKGASKGNKRRSRSRSPASRTPSRTPLSLTPRHREVSQPGIFNHLSSWLGYGISDTVENSTSDDELIEIIDSQGRRWLCYWICWALVWMCRSYLFNTVVLFLSLVLQNALWPGGIKLINYVIGFYTALREGWYRASAIASRMATPVQSPVEKSTPDTYTNVNDDDDDDYVHVGSVPIVTTPTTTPRKNGMRRRTNRT